MSKLAKIKNQIRAYAQDESGALSTVEMILIILAVVVLVAFVVNWLWGMIKDNTSAGTQHNNDYNSIINGIQ